MSGKENLFGDDLTGPKALLRDLEKMPKFGAKDLGKFRDKEELERAIANSNVKSGMPGETLDDIELDTSGI